MTYILGIDQGSSKTHAIVGSAEGDILGFGVSRGACHSSSGIEDALAAIGEAAAQALTQSGLTMGQIAVLAAGMTGVDWPEEPALVREALCNRFCVPQVMVVNDCIIALRAETNSSRGAILCAGSGLNCAVKRDWQTEYVYGFYINDTDQGGGALGRLAVDAVIDAESGIGPQTALTPLVLDSLGAANVDALLRRKVTGGLSGREYLSLPILLEQAAMENDPVALGIWADYGLRIAGYVLAGLERLNILSVPIDVVLSGSIFKCKVPALRDGVCLGIHRRAVNANVIDARYEPVLGAYLLGLDTLWQDIPQHVSAAVTQNAGTLLRKQ